MVDVIPDAPAAERNKHPIFDAMRERLSPGSRVLEAGSGTAVHGHWFCSQLPGLVWQLSNPPGDNHSAQLRYERHADIGLQEPIDLDLIHGPWTTAERYDLVFAVNVLHIAPWQATAGLFKGAAQVTDQSAGAVTLYGPWRYASRPLEPGNVQFDAQLRAGNPDSGIRLFEDLVAIARENGFSLAEDLSMPANNHLLTFQRSS